jgi:hypothetical protein
MLCPPPAYTQHYRLLQPQRGSPAGFLSQVARRNAAHFLQQKSTDDAAYPDASVFADMVAAVDM